MSFATASKLDLVDVKVRKVTTNTNLIEQYPNVFKRIGKLRNYEVKLHIDDTVQPVAQSARPISFHLRKKVAADLNKLEEQDIIGKVEGPTAVFSKLDLHSGYHQLSLAPEGGYITTFATHKGLRQYKGLNFGTNSANEIFQHVISEQIRYVSAAINISDDIIVFGKTQPEHDQAILQRFADSGLTISPEMCELHKDSLTVSHQTLQRSKQYTMHVLPHQLAK